MKVLLVNPPRSYYPGSSGVRVGLPLGLMYLAGVLEEHGYRPTILDCMIHAEATVSTDGDRTIHGIPAGTITEEIRKAAPDVVGIANPFTVQVENAVAVAGLVKRVDPRILTVVGGPHVSVAGRRLLEEHGTIDIGVVGEGETPFLEIVQGLPPASIESLVYRGSDGRVEETRFGGYSADLDRLPFPAYHLVDMALYFRLLEQGFITRPSARNRSISLITSRGCPYDCVFCSIHLHMGRKWRAHSADHVLRHLEHVVTTYGVDHVSFEDDNFSFDLDRTRAILDGIVRRDLRITWDTPNGVRADRLDEDLARLMKASGCSELTFGVESGEQRVLDHVIRKKLSLDDVVRSAETCARWKIAAKAFFVVGFPGETTADMRKTLDFALMLRRKYRVQPGFMIATPLLGTRLYEICKKNGYLTEEPDPRLLAAATQPQGRGLIRTPDFDHGDLQELASTLATEMARIERLETLTDGAKLLRLARSFVRLQAAKAAGALRGGWSAAVRLARAVRRRAPG